MRHITKRACPRSIRISHDVGVNVGVALAEQAVTLVISTRWEKTLVELRGFEPLTSAVRLQRSPI
jgi:hypothetical protein